ncbi:AsmA family protein [Aliishimia ponticola]|uniref:AsmA family protein n=1 Tax=Aliishimia ponticola TaxID=2499833 RepID=A0A4S4NAC7_9RHOB|nr:AsmA family protein [Aliishimia ponticola]
MRWIARIIGIVVMLVVLAVGAVLLMPADKVAQLAADQIRAATGRDVSITGDVAMTFWPVVGARVGALEVGNAEWSEQGPMLTAQNAALGVDAAALLRGEIRITNIEAQSPTIRLESRNDGRASWLFTDGGGAAQIETTTSPDSAPRAVSIERLDITDATLIYDAEGADLVSYSGVDLTLDWPEREGPARIDAVVRPTNTPVTISANIARFDRFIAGGVEAVDVALTSDAGAATLKGLAAISGDVAGKLTLRSGNTDGFLRALGLPGADLPQGLGRSVDMSAELALSGDRFLSLTDLSADLGGNRIAGTAEVSLNGTPNVKANLDAGPLDLRAALGGSSADAGGGSSSGAAQGWSRAPIDASGLAAFNGTIALRADSIDLGSLKLGATRTELRNDNSRMVFALQDVAAYGGALRGEFVMNNRNGLSVGGKLTGSGLQLQGLLSDLAGLTRLTGAAEAELNFLGVGQSVDAIMRSLSGGGRLALGRGTIEGIDLDQLMRSGSGAGGTTVFDSLTGSFTMAGGNLENKDLLMKLARFEVRGAGRVGLGAQDIDYLFTPVALNARDGKDVSIPVRVRGAWSGPKILPDLKAAVEQNLVEERKQLESQVREKVEDKVKKELGVTQKEGQSLEDAAKEELGRQLRKLFD